MGRPFEAKVLSLRERSRFPRLQTQLRTSRSIHRSGWDRPWWCQIVGAIANSSRVGKLTRTPLQRMSTIHFSSYQVRFALLEAGHYGTPQGRVRFFLWAAKSDYPLPEFPRPTHNFPCRTSMPIKFPTGITVSPIDCREGITQYLLLLSRTPLAI